MAYKKQLNKNHVNTTPPDKKPPDTASFVHWDEEEIRHFFQNQYQKFGIPPPHLHFVLGSCMGDTWDRVKKKATFSNWEHKGHLSFVEVPGLPSPSAPTHKGCYEYFVHKCTGEVICFQSGRLHGYEGLSPRVVARTVIGPRLAGTRNFILSNIAGGLKPTTPVGSVVVIQDHLNFTGCSPLKGEDFVDMTKAYHPTLTRTLAASLKKQNLDLHFGVYAGVAGPELETPAEIKFFISAGADIVGMSTIMEVIALNSLKTQVAAVSVVSNMASGIGKSVQINIPLLQPAFEKLINSFILFAEASLKNK